MTDEDFLRTIKLRRTRAFLVIVLSSMLLGAWRRTFASIPDNEQPVAMICGSISAFGTLLGASWFFSGQHLLLWRIDQQDKRRSQPARTTHDWTAFTLRTALSNPVGFFAIFMAGGGLLILHDAFVFVTGCILFFASFVLPFIELWRYRQLTKQQLD